MTAAHNLAGLLLPRTVDASDAEAAAAGTVDGGAWQDGYGITREEHAVLAYRAAEALDRYGDLLHLRGHLKVLSEPGEAHRHAYVAQAAAELVEGLTHRVLAERAALEAVRPLAFWSSEHEEDAR